MRENSFKALKKRKSLCRRVLSAALVVALVIGILPTQTKTASAASATVKLANLGSLGTVDYGSKTKSGTWWMMNLTGGGASKYGSRAFCMTLGASCRSGMTYNNDGSDDKEWDSEPTNAKNKVYYYVARWYVLDRKYSKKAYTLSQALIWAAELGYDSEDDLLDVIRQVKKFSDDLFPSKTAKELYEDIFEPSDMTYGGESYDTWTANTIVYEVTNTSNPSGYQELVMLDASPENTITPPTEYFPTTYATTARYRQRIIVNKVDEDEEPVAGVDFSLTIDDFDEVYSVSVNGSNTSDDDFDNNVTVTVSGTTDENGQIIFQITYELSTDEYYYYTDDDWDEWLADSAVPQEQVLAARNYLKYDLELEPGVAFWDTAVNGYDYNEVSMDGAQALADADLEKKIAAVSNNYILTEEDVNNVDMLVDETYGDGVSITIESDESWLRPADGDYWSTDGWSDASYATLVEVTNDYKKITVDVTKINGREPSL